MSSAQEMHEQHVRANHDHAEWLRDISHWRVDHRKSLAILSRIEATIHDFDAEMEAHASAIRDHHLHIAHHEKEIAASPGSSTEELHAMYLRAHDESTAIHADVAQHHSALAIAHQQMMENLGALFEALADD